MTDEGQLLAGRYRLVRRLGAGAMGVVWEGHDERLDRTVAIKQLRLRPGLPQDKTTEAVARCLREGRIAARLHHPNAITVFDVVDEDNVPNLVMEYMPSRSLAKAVAEDGSLAPREVAAIGAQIATALTAAHDAGIVHRDITPGNILLGEDGSVKLTDFGISRAADDVAATTTGRFAGTPAYLAPEVAHGSEPTPASDVFSLGATLYAAIEGAPPFGRASNILALLHTVAGGEINPPQRSGPLTDVLLALLTVDPHARPTATQAHDLLAAAATTPDDGNPTDAAPTELVRPLPAAQAPTAPAAGRAQKPLAAAGVLVVALAAVGLWLLGSNHGLTPFQEREPADGKVPNHSTRTSGPAPISPVGEPIDIRETRSNSAPTSRPAQKKTTSEAEAPAATNDAPAPPITTTNIVDEPTTSVPTDPPTSSEPETTAPNTAPG
ncbi:MAG: protein kinase domain-containing protein [Actinophytocola sp.]|uniref:serine/threonine-protein kinase n=1 Tax=Actinophytocola sp. TaxID=1872138 RepID=UPI003D6AE70D